MITKINVLSEIDLISDVIYSDMKLLIGKKSLYKKREEKCLNTLKKRKEIF
jgi:hypothetical protein